ncbi:MAG: hypothetical protein WCY58_09675 [Mariniphaga sp.]|nr:hypothetical protein [Mariniphaga sp.]MDD4225105.1 hypothetical protein [Mariniphaga sp.]MDD4424439.1 hypothetical protein [Mariniphaga sp.]
MGRAYTYRCDNCGFEEQFNEGYGFLIHPQSLDEYFKSREILFHHKTHQVLRRLINQKENILVDAGFKIFRCPHCHLLFNKISVTVTDHEKVIHKSEFRCNRCKARLKLTNIHRLKKAVCPVCKKSAFRIDQRKMILWD